MCPSSAAPTTGLTEESPGVRSSKRVAGLTLIGSGAALLLTVGLVAIFRGQPMPNAQLSIVAGQSLAGIGAALLGVTVVEAFAKS